MVSYVKQRHKLIYVDTPPEGLFYIPRFISPEEETALLAHVQAQPFAPYDHHGYKANREVVYFGMQGGYNGVGAEDKAEPMPEWLLPLRDKIAHAAGLDAAELEMALVARYTPGAGIGWHRDRPQFGPTVFGVSLQSDAQMRFRRYVEATEEMYKINLEHGSAYIMSGPSRSVWQHGMNPVKELRYSITFRTIKNKAQRTVDPRHSPVAFAQHLNNLGIEYQMTPHAVPPRSKQLRLAL